MRQNGRPILLRMRFNLMSARSVDSFSQVTQTPGARPTGRALRTRKAEAQAVCDSAPVVDELPTVAAKAGVAPGEARQQLLAALEEMVTVQSPLFGFLLNRVLVPLQTRAWELDVDTEELRRLRVLGEQHSLVFLPTHRSYADTYVVMKLLRAAGMPPNHVLGGDNLRFFPLGTIARRAGAILIRRSFRDDQIYKFALRAYFRFLVDRGSNLEWYMEGGRSRTGKLRPPRYGLLSYLVRALEGSDREILLVPLSITYDQLQEVSAMAAEEAGGGKPKEGLGWLAGYLRDQGRRQGMAHIRFGETFSLRQALAPDQEGAVRWTLPKIAFEVFQRLNRATPVTAPALVTLALLGVHDQALTLDEVRATVGPLLDYAVQRGLPTVALADLRQDQGIQTVLDALVANGVVRHHDGGIEPVYYIAPGQHGVAAFYRNSAIHCFVNRAILELAVMVAAQQGAGGALDRGFEAALAWRDLLKFEFFFSEKPAFRDEMLAEARLIDPGGTGLVPGPTVSPMVLEQAPFLIAHRVLPAFLEAYFIVAERLAAQPADAHFDRRAFLQHCTTVGQQYLLQKRLRHPECVSNELFTNALSLAENRGLLAPADSPERVGLRQAFAEETAAAVSALEAIGTLDHRLRHSPQEIR